MNTTEFLFCENPIKEVFDENIQTSFSVMQINAYSPNECDPSSINELFGSLLNDNIKFYYDRGERYIHNFQHGNYTLGRHSTKNPIIHTNKFHIIYLGFCPINSKTLDRKLQIQKNISERDKKLGLGKHHLMTKEQILSLIQGKININNENSLQKMNSSLFHLLNAYLHR